MTDDVNEEIIAARIQRAQANADLTDANQHREEVKPLWQRVFGNPIYDSFGEELELSLTRKKAS